MEDDLRNLVARCTAAQSSNPLVDELEAFRAAQGLTRGQFLHHYARHVAQSFAEGALAFWDGNHAMNQLGGIALEELDGFALEIFHAFDHGEFLEGEEPYGALPWQRYTLPLVVEALVREGLTPNA